MISSTLFHVVDTISTVFAVLFCTSRSTSAPDVTSKTSTDILVELRLCVTVNGVFITGTTISV